MNIVVHIKIMRFFARIVVAFLCFLVLPIVTPFLARNKSTKTQWPGCYERPQRLRVDLTPVQPAARVRQRLVERLQLVHVATTLQRQHDPQDFSLVHLIINILRLTLFTACAGDNRNVTPEVLMDAGEQTQDHICTKEEIRDFRDD